MTDETTYVRMLGRYQLLDEIGRGGMAVVYRALDPIIGRTVAIKTIAFTTGEAEADALRERLFREAVAAGTLSHPNIVTIYDVIQEGSTTAVAMEFIEGQTLAQLVAERAPLAIDRALEIFEQMVAAIDYAGSKGIVHRDIKPANILMTAEGRVKVADFGVARIAMSQLTQTGTVVGSPSYMSPEQIRGQVVDTRSDLFSAAVVFYELVTKERPFAGNDVATTMYRIVNEPPTPASQFNAAIGPTLTAVFERALAKDPAARYRSGAELHRAFREAATVGAPLAAVADRAAPRGRSRAKLLALAALPIVLLLGLVVVGSLSKAPPESPANRPASRIEAPAVPGTTVPGPPPATVSTQTHALPDAEPPAEPVAPAAPLTGPISTIPPVAPQAEPARARPAAPTPAATRPRANERKGVRSSDPAAPAGPAAAPARQPDPTPEPRAEPPRPALPASLRVSFAEASYPVTILADGIAVGRIADPGDRVSVAAGRVRLHAVNDALYLDRDFGAVALEPGGEHSLSLPATASAFIGVRGDSYAGLQILLDGRPVAGPYPAQIARLVAARHHIVFRWDGGVLQGVEVSDTIDLADGRHFSIQAVPDNAQVIVRKVR